MILLSKSINLNMYMIGINEVRGDADKRTWRRRREDAGVESSKARRRQVEQPWRSSCFFRWSTHLRQRSEKRIPTHHWNSTPGSSVSDRAHYHYTFTATIRVNKLWRKEKWICAIIWDVDVIRESCRRSSCDKQLFI